MKAWFSSAQSASAALLLAFLGPLASAQSLPEQALTVGDRQITAEIADSPDTRARGLMYRESMPADAGMLFVYDNEAERCFWMRNTLIPLSLAYIDAGGEILQILDMQPLTETSHCSDEGAQYALEMNQGWFDRNDIGPGDTLRPLP